MPSNQFASGLVQRSGSPVDHGDLAVGLCKQQLTVGTDSLPEPPGVIGGTAWFGTSALASFRVTWWCLNITAVLQAAPSVTFAGLAAVPEPEV